MIKEELLHSFYIILFLGYLLIQDVGDCGFRIAPSGQYCSFVLLLILINAKYGESHVLQNL